MYLTKRRTTRPVINVADISTGKTVPVTIEVDTTKTFLDVGRARWMPDGRSILFLGENRLGLLGVFVQAFTPGQNTANTRRAVAGFDADSVTESFGVSADGLRLILAR